MDLKTGYMDRKNGSVGEEQPGFRRDHSTIDHIFTLFAVIQKYLLHKKKEKEEEEEKTFKNTLTDTHKQKKLYVAFIYLKKAFDLM